MRHVMSQRITCVVERILDVTSGVKCRNWHSQKRGRPSQHLCTAVKAAGEDGRLFKVQGRGGRGGDDHRPDTGVHRDHDRRVCRATSHHRK